MYESTVHQYHHKTSIIFPKHTKDDSFHTETTTKVILWHQPCDHKHKTDKTQLKFVNKKANIEKKENRNHQDHTFSLSLTPTQEEKNPRRGMYWLLQKKWWFIMGITANAFVATKLYPKNQGHLSKTSFCRGERKF